MVNFFCHGALPFTKLDAKWTIERHRVKYDVLQLLVATSLKSCGVFAWGTWRQQIYRLKLLSSHYVTRVSRRGHQFIQPLKSKSSVWNTQSFSKRQNCPKKKIKSPRTAPATSLCSRPSSFRHLLTAKEWLDIEMSDLVFVYINKIARVSVCLYACLSVTPRKTF